LTAIVDGSMEASKTVAIIIENTEPTNMGITGPESVKLATNLEHTFEISGEGESLSYSCTLLEAVSSTDLSSSLSLSITTLTLPSDTLSHSLSYTVTCRIDSSTGYGFTLLDFSSSGAIDTTNASVTLSPESGMALDTEFTITGEGFIDPEDTLLTYSFYYRVNTEDDSADSILISLDSDSNAVNSVFPGHPTDDVLYDVLVYAKNVYGEIGMLVASVEITPFVSEDPQAFIQDSIQDMTPEEQAQFIDEAFDSLVPPVLDKDPDILNDGCGGCVYGTCDTATATCVCDEGYTQSLDCSLTDQEVEDNLSVISALLESKSFLF
jgi:hypothetical protein